mmetsp:Transcript_12749/g.22543  ORF Transcript_12749/g.22543 Transcript_12749/m.22543 type:complete len:153 (-) Transcript_12749:227-685(-)|eukprot:CAMPEP_0119116356 /NCGR_PEP_ID=MMETSP1180-20130426/52239_1 /TAXON_ID=3052 ORGANISM="Chlamydomonas cf sp, Strain CCMP681" /NCGR_SAMPLE_ID=MMETSP1180 /ASSEMBLY_ACC=CAM_ASM_000741 /LENGTH=152 /DNA_ID=CAMNT_0007105493 /DNA_START=34 /DNA_END=492 /DNA_ORIENTATION=-
MWSKAVIWEKLQALFWALLALGVVLYGNGKQNLWTLASGEQVTKLFIWVGLVCWGLIALLFIYSHGSQLVTRCRGGPFEPLSSRSWIVQAGAGCFATAFVAFTAGLFPVYFILSPVIVLVVTFGGVMGLNFIPTFGLLKPLGPPDSEHAHAD